MAGITPISLVRYINSTSISFDAGQKLSAQTKSKLIALGVDANMIKTEKEGQIKLREAQLERYSNNQNVSFKKDQETNDVLQEARNLASKLDIQTSENDTVDEIVDKITNKISEMKTNAGEDFDKLADVNYYEKQLAMLETAHLSQIDLNATLNLTANMNAFYHGLY